MAEQVLVFENFSGGDSGRSRPQMSDPTTFRAINAWQYDDGIGPRPPFMDWGITGLPQQRLKTFNVMRGTDGLLYMVWSFADKSVYRCRAAAGTTATSAGTLAFEPVDSCIFGDSVFFVSNLGNGGSVLATGSVTDLPNLPAGYCIERFGQQAVVATTGSTIRWSALNDFTSWPTENTNTVGNNQYIARLFNQRNSLVVARLDGEVWTYTGVLGVNEVLRRSDTTVRHRFPLEAPGCVVNQSDIWWCGIREMVQYTGAKANLVTRPDIPVISGFDINPWDSHVGAVHPLQDDDEFLVFGTADKLDGSNKKQVWAHGFRPGAGWTRHVIPVTDYKMLVNGGGVNSSRYSAEAIKPNQVCHEGFAFVTTTSDTSANGGSTPQVFAFFSTSEMPLIPAGVVVAADLSVYTVNDGKSGAPVSATFSGAEHWDGNGAQITVRSVLVDYSYNPNFTPVATYNHFDLSVEALQNQGSVAVNASTAQSFTPPASGSTPDGTPVVRGQARFQMGDQGSGVGFRILLSNWRGIVVHRITALLDAAPGRS